MTTTVTGTTQAARWRLVALAATATLIVVPSLTFAFAAPEAADDTPQVKETAKAKTNPFTSPSTKKAFTGKKVAKPADDGGALVDNPSGAKLPELPKKVVKSPTLTSAGLDELVDAFLASTKAEVAPLTNDVEFVRRIYLDVTGRLPTPEQARAFVNTREKDRRAKLIQRLLDSPEYATNWSRYWRDVIEYHATNQNFGRIGFADLESWLKDQIAANRPWDEVAQALITATGRTDENGATVFSLAHESMPAEMAGEVARVFLGVQIQCAQCHDHPNDSWKRQQFHEFASFFSGTKSAIAVRAQANNGRPVFQVVNRGPSRYTMPDLKDPAKAIPVAPKFFLDHDAPTLPSGLSAKERHELAASYVTRQDNPWFARAFVNRIWYALTGESFYTPVDDLGPDRKAKAPAVINTLAAQWQQGGYDVKWLFRTILNSKAYQREVRSTLSASGRTSFAANCPSRLRADQILDSLAQALNLPLDGRGPVAGKGPGQGQGAAVKKAALTKDLKDAVGKTKGMRPNAGPRPMFNLVFGVDPSTPNDDVLGTIPQALFLMNSPMVNRAIEARPGTVLGEILTSTPDNRTALNLLYVRVLSREPTGKEVQTCGRYLEAVGNRREAFEDILWSLINSTEFITRR
jgi:hypothetical protein